MNKHFKYLRYLIKHKWYVWKAGRQFGHAIPKWRLLIHDYSKFSPKEWSAYADRFMSGSAGVEDKSNDSDSFRKAWVHHWHTNPHHWEYWIQSDGQPLKMPENFIYEMIADWLGASKGITGSWDLTKWYMQTRPKQLFHPETKRRVEWIMDQTVPYVIERLSQ